MNTAIKDVKFGDPELMYGPIEEGPRVTGNASCNHWDCDGLCMVIEDVPGDETIAKQDADEPRKPKFDYKAINKYRQEQYAKGQCEIGVYVLGLHCTQPAKHGWGHGSIIHVCDIHSTWNPFMLEGGKCPDCGDLADHYPCKAEENVELQDEDVEGDDIIAKQDAEEIATNRRTGKVDVCPGCGATLYEFIWREGQTFGETTYMVDAHGLYHFGPGGCADPCGERRTEYYPIEFELKGKDGKRSGVTLGENPQDAIRNFLADYPTSGDCGTIVAIRVPGVDTGGLA